jgi:hypothetical protein
VRAGLDFGRLHSVSDSTEAERSARQRESVAASRGWLLGVDFPKASKGFRIGISSDGSAPFAGRLRPVCVPGTPWAAPWPFFVTPRYCPRSANNPAALRIAATPGAGKGTPGSRG